MTIDKIIFRTQKDKMLLDYHDGGMATAVGEYLQESGIKDPTRFRFGGDKAIAAVKKIKDERAKSVKDKKPAKVAAPYVQLGISGKDLVIQIKDNSNSKFEENTVMMKGFLDEIEKEKNKTDAVVNVSPDKEESTIKKATKNIAERRGVEPTTEDDTDFGEITGNIVLCAHGMPKILPGRVIGQKLGRKTPEQIVEILTGSSDKAKRIPKSYSNVITLSGCYTASGGPEEDKADPVFAKKVRDLLGSKGYKYVRVEGMPGPSWTSGSDKMKDDYGTQVKKGDEGVWHAMEGDSGIKAFQMRIDQNVEKLNVAFDNWKGTQEEFDNHPKVQELVEKMRADSADIERVVANKLKAATPEERNKINASKDIAALTGYFGPTKYKTKPWYKKLFA